MAGSSDLATKDTRKRKSVSRPNKEATSNKPSALSEEIIYQSDSEGKTENRSGITKNADTRNGKLSASSASLVSNQATKPILKTKVKTATSKAVSPAAANNTKSTDERSSSHSPEDFEQISREDEGENESETNDSAQKEPKRPPAKYDIFIVR